MASSSSCGHGRRGFLSTAAALLLVLLAACARRPEAVLPSPAASSRVEQAFPRAAPSEVGVDAGQLAAMLREIAGKKGIDSILVLRHGKVILEAHRYLHGPGARHALYSCTKSVTSMLTGIAIGDGLIDGVTTPVRDLFPGRKLAGPKGAITLRDLLTMQSGLAWTEDRLPGGPIDSITEVALSPDPVQYLLDLPLVQEPGSAFHYSSGNSHLIGAIVQQRTGRKLADYAREKLFGPLGITDVFWQETADGLSWGGFGLQLRPEDMAKLGQLFLQRGAWNGRQVVPETWVAESTLAWSHPPPEASPGGYGYQWWLTGFGYAAMGLGGQAIFVDPEHDLVAVFCSALPQGEMGLPWQLMGRYVLPAVSAGGARDADPELAAAIARFQPKPEARPIALPALARKIDGAWFEMENGERYTISFPDGSEAIARIRTRQGDLELRIGLDGVPRVNARHPLSGVPGRGPAAYAGWFEGDTFVVRHAPVDGADEILFTVRLEGSELEIATRSFHFGAVYGSVKGRRL